MHSVIIFALLCIVAVLVLTNIASIYAGRRKTRNLLNESEMTKKALNSCHEALGKTETALKKNQQEFLSMQQSIKKSKDDLNAFSYAVTHDLRAPLRAINGYCEILEEDYHDKLDERGKNVIRVIQQNIVRMNLLIGGLQEFTKLEETSVLKQKFSMEDVVSKALHGKSFSADTRLAVSPMGEAFGDARLIERVWENLISNAIKFTSKRKDPAIEIGCQSKKNEQIYWIKDNGIGFDLQYTHKLFRIFSRLHGKKEFEGIGAGLAIAMRIVDIHGGRMWAESELQEGTVFYFSLPFP